MNQPSLMINQWSDLSTQKQIDYMTYLTEQVRSTFTGEPIMLHLENCVVSLLNSFVWVIYEIDDRVGHIMISRTRSNIRYGTMFRTHSPTYQLVFHLKKPQREIVIYWAPVSLKETRIRCDLFDVVVNVAQPEPAVLVELLFIFLRLVRTWCGLLSCKVLSDT